MNAEDPLRFTEHIFPFAKHLQQLIAAIFFYLLLKSLCENNWLGNNRFERV